MNLRNLPTTFLPPTPEERKRSIKELKWYLFDTFGYQPHDAQMDFHLSEARYRMTIAGTRGGKSRSAGEEAVPYLFAGATRVWIVGQSYSLTEKEFRYVFERMTSQEVLGMFGGISPLESAICNEAQGNMYIRTKWGSWCKCISLDKTAASALGEEVDLIIMSEAAQIKNPQKIYQRTLRGRLASRLGDVIIPTTPAGKTNKWDEEGWLFNMYLKGYDEDEPNYFTREWPSWANPDFKDDVNELKRELDPKIFDEQYRGKFMVFSGAVYNEFNENVHVIPKFQIPKHWHRYESIDPGYSGQFVWISAVMSENGNLYIVDEYSDKKMRYAERSEQIFNQRCEQYRIPHGMWEKLAKKNNIKTMLYIDPEDPQCIAELMALGLAGSKANNNVMVGIDRVARRLRFTNISTPTVFVTENCIDTIEAFKFHSWGDKNTAADVRKPANDKWKHWMDCVRYLCAGNLVSSPPPVEKPAEEETLYEMMQTLIAAQNKETVDLSAYERRVGGI